MQIKYGPYNIRAHELDNKLSVQVTSELGKVYLKEEQKHARNFPNEMCFTMDDPTEKPEAKGVRRYSFGEYTFILGINFSGELCLFHSDRLYVGKKFIDNIDTLTLAFLTEPKSL